MCNHASEQHDFNFPFSKAFKSIKLKEGQIIFVNKQNEVNEFELLRETNNQVFEIADGTIQSMNKMIQSLVLF